MYCSLLHGASYVDFAQYIVAEFELLWDTETVFKCKTTKQISTEITSPTTACFHFKFDCHSQASAPYVQIWVLVIFPLQYVHDSKYKQPSLELSLPFQEAWIFQLPPHCIHKDIKIYNVLLMIYENCLHSVYHFTQFSNFNEWKAYLGEITFAHTRSLLLISYSCCNVGFLSVRKHQVQFPNTEEISNSGMQKQKSCVLLCIFNS